MCVNRQNWVTVNCRNMERKSNQRVKDVLLSSSCVATGHRSSHAQFKCTSPPTLSFFLIQTNFNSTHTIFVIAIVLWYMHDGRMTSGSPKTNWSAFTRWSTPMLCCLILLFYRWSDLLLLSPVSIDVFHCTTNRIYLFQIENDTRRMKIQKKHTKYFQSILNDSTNNTDSEKKIAKNFASSRSTCCFWLALN